MLPRLTVAFALLVAICLPAGGCSGRQRQIKEQKAAAEVGAADQDQTPAPDDDEIVCRIVRETGSHIRRKVCKSRFMWRAEHESAQELLRRPRAGPDVGH